MREICELEELYDDAVTVYGGKSEREKVLNLVCLLTYSPMNGLGGVFVPIYRVGSWSLFRDLLTILFLLRTKRSLMPRIF